MSLTVIVSTVNYGTTVGSFARARRRFSVPSVALYAAGDIRRDSSSLFFEALGCFRAMLVLEKLVTLSARSGTAACTA